MEGPGHIVAIDESVVARAKPATNRHARPVLPQWVFGAVDITIYHRRIFHGAGGTSWRRHAHLHHPAARHLRYLGMERRIGCVQWLGCCRLRAWDSEPFPTLRQPCDGGTHEQHWRLETRWAACKATLRRRYSVPRDMLPRYLDEYMWRTRRSRTQCFDDILDVIRRRYPVWKSETCGAFDFLAPPTGILFLRHFFS